jgi:hypothetical protein
MHWLLRERDSCRRQRVVLAFLLGKIFLARGGWFAPKS